VGVIEFEDLLVASPELVGVSDTRRFFGQLATEREAVLQQSQVASQRLLVGEFRMETQK
jgi:septum formation inhibitor-activating ATPase MinD